MGYRFHRAHFSG
jgi:hypothetical protein